MAMATTFLAFCPPYPSRAHSPPSDRPTRLSLRLSLMRACASSQTSQPSSFRKLRNIPLDLHALGC
eukprot:758341-Pleurochrysis_carterae.AAC.1